MLLRLPQQELGALAAVAPAARQVVAPRLQGGAGGQQGMSLGAGCAGRFEWAGTAWSWRAVQADNPAVLLWCFCASIPQQAHLHDSQVHALKGAQGARHSADTDGPLQRVGRQAGGCGMGSPRVNSVFRNRFWHAAAAQARQVSCSMQQMLAPRTRLGADQHHGNVVQQRRRVGEHGLPHAVLLPARKGAAAQHSRQAQF